MSHIHIPDGVLPVWLWTAGWLAALLMIALAGCFAARSQAQRKVPLLGVVAALMIVGMSSEIVPIAYHVNLSVIGGILLGPALSVIAAFVVGLVLAMLGHGGVTVLGLNTMVIGAEMLIGWALFRGIVSILGRRRAGLSAGLTTVMTLALTTTALVGIVWLGGGGQAADRETGALDPATLRFERPLEEGVLEVGLFGGGHDHDHAHDDHNHHDDHDHAHDESERFLSVGRFAAVVYTLGPIGWLIEALVTAGIIGYVARIRPAMVFEGALAEKARRIPGDEAGGM